MVNRMNVNLPIFMITFTLNFENFSFIVGTDYYSKAIKIEIFVYHP